MSSGEAMLPPESRPGESSPAGGPAFGRLKRRADFLAVAGRGRKQGRGALLVQVLQHGEGQVRLGFTATKKLGNAVVRNRAKRRMRAAARAEFAAKPAQGHDIVLVAREAIRQNSFADLCEDLRAALIKLGLPR
ncbi:ribonuclease P protein component [Rhodovarius sp.]|uniref:ribonuclease P protein component n=1 Tax=Rhodovarius sp. TaxID=2972673 RepID=UPI003341D544